MERLSKLSPLELSIPLAPGELSCWTSDWNSLRHLLLQPTDLSEGSKPVFTATLSQLPAPDKHDQETQSPQKHVDSREPGSVPQSDTSTNKNDPLLFQAVTILRHKFDRELNCSLTTMRGEIEFDGQPALVVCKLIVSKEEGIHHANLRHEVDLYQNQLKPLQGTVVPEFYGIFTGALLRSSKTSQERATCILLENCGEAISYCLEDLKEHQLIFIHCVNLYHIDCDSSVAIKNAFHQLHEAGVVHGSIDYEGNILKADGPNGDTRIVLVDFAIASVHSPGKCCLGPKQLYEDFSLETRESIEWCPELFHLYSIIEDYISPQG